MKGEVIPKKQEVIFVNAEQIQDILFCELFEVELSDLLIRQRRRPVSVQGAHVWKLVCQVEHGLEFSFLRLKALKLEDEIKVNRARGAEDRSWNPVIVQFVRSIFAIAFVIRVFVTLTETM